MSPDLFAALVALGIVAAVVALGSLVYLYSRTVTGVRVQRRLDPRSAEAAGMDGSTTSVLIQSLADQGKKIEGLVDTSKESSRLLIQAGWRTQRERVAFYAASALTPIVFLGLAAVFWYAGPPKLTQPAMILISGALALMMGLLLPRVVLRRRAEARVRRIKSEVPLLIHLLVLLFESGLSTRQAFGSMVRDGRGVLPELGREFELVLRQLDAGGDTNEVLKNLAAGIDLDDLTNVLALLRQVDRYGGEVRDPLLETLEVLEERRTMDMREMVNLISGRMTIVMVGFFFPALLIFVAGPAFMSILRALGGGNN